MVHGARNLESPSRVSVRNSVHAGFSTVELLVVIALVLVVAGMSIPSVQAMLKTYRASSDTRSIAQLIALANMRARAGFTRAKVVINTSSSTYHLEIYNKTSSTWQTEGGTYSLAQTVSFGYGSISTPAGSQSAISQSTDIIFNSRGMPIDGTGAVTRDFAAYLMNGSGSYYAITVSVASRVQTWKYGGSAWVSL